MKKHKLLLLTGLAAFVLIMIIFVSSVLVAAETDSKTIIGSLEVKMNKAEEGNEIASLFEFENQDEMLLKVPEGAPYTAKLVHIRFNTGVSLYEEGADWLFVRRAKIRRNEPYIVRVEFRAKDGYKLDVSGGGDKYVESMKVTGLETGKGKDIEVWSGSAYNADGSTKQIDFVYSLGIGRLGLHRSIYPEIGKPVTVSLSTAYTDTAYWIAGAPGPFEYKAVVAPVGTEVQTVNVFGQSTCYIQLTATNAMSGGTMIIRATAADGQTVDLPVKVNAVSGGHKHTYGELGIIDYQYHGRMTCTDPACPGIAPAFDEGAEKSKHDFRGGCTKVCAVCGDVGNPDGKHNFEWKDKEKDTGYHYKTCGCGEIEKDEKGNEVKEAHHGGKANCYFGAACEVCGRIYTEKGGHKYEFKVPENTFGKVHYYFCAYCGEENADYRHAPKGGTATCAKRAVCEYEKNGVKCGTEYGDYVDHRFIQNECVKCKTPLYIKDIEITVPEWVEGGSVNAVKIPIIEKGNIYRNPNSTWFGYSKVGSDSRIFMIDTNIMVIYHFRAQANCKFWGKIDDINVTVNGKGEFFDNELSSDGNELTVRVLLHHSKIVQEISLDFEAPMEKRKLSDLKVVEKNGLEIVDIKEDLGTDPEGKFVKNLPSMLYITLKAPEGKIFEKPLSYEDMFCKFGISGAEYYAGERAKISEDGTLLTVLVKLPRAVECNHEGATLVEGKAPTCTENGVVDKFVCPYCGAAFRNIECTEVWNESERIVPALGHKYDESVFESDKTSHYHVCETCNEKVGAEEHKPDRAGATEELPVKCTVCGYIITPVIGHTHRLTLVPGKDATCQADGKNGYYTCDGCSELFEDEAGTKTITSDIAGWGIIPKAHKFGEWTAEVPATKEAAGTKAHKDCEFCGKHFDNDGNEITDLTIAKLPSDEDQPGENDTSGSDSTSGGDADPGNKVIEPAKEGLSGGAIAGIVIGSVAVVGIGGFAIFWFAIKKKTFADLVAVFKKK